MYYNSHILMCVLHVLDENVKLFDLVPVSSFGGSRMLVVDIKFLVFASPILSATLFVLQSIFVLG